MKRRTAYVLLVTLTSLGTRNSCSVRHIGRLVCRVHCTLSVSSGLWRTNGHVGFVHDSPCLERNVQLMVTLTLRWFDRTTISLGPKKPHLNRGMSSAADDTGFTLLFNTPSVVTDTIRVHDMQQYSLSLLKPWASLILKRAQAFVPWLILFQCVVIAILYGSGLNCEVDQSSVILPLKNRRAPRIVDHSQRELQLGDSLHPERIVYNRVPKCGSSTLLDLIRIMGNINNFTLEESQRYMMYIADEFEQRAVVDRIRSISTPMIYERHLHFINFKQLGVDSLTYINLIRDPFDRLVSWYYYRRFQKGHMRVMQSEDRFRTYDDCVLGNYSECVDPLGHEPEIGYFKIIPFFCGQQPFCRVPSDDSLAQAINNVKRHFVLVGILDEYSSLIKVLEYTFPTYFKGITAVYEAIGATIHSKYLTSKKSTPSYRVRKIMMAKLAHEYQFYNFVRRRFWRYTKMVESKTGVSIT